MSFAGMTHTTLAKRTQPEGGLGWLFGLPVVASLWMIGRWWWEHHILKLGPKRLENNDNKRSSDINGSHHKSSSTTRTVRFDLGSPSDPNQAFEEAAAQMRQSSSLNLSNEDRLLLYALYKQATQSDAPLVRLSLDFTDQAKHHAWSHLRGMPQDLAKQKYVELARELQQTPSSSDEDSGLESLGAGVSSRPAVADHSTPNAQDMSPHDRLFAAAGQDDVETVRSLLSSHAVAANDRDAEGQTALHIAADAGALGVLQLLLQHGGHVGAADKYGISVLQAAVIAGHVAICQWLLQHGADPDQQDSDGDTPRNCAVDDGGKEMRALFSVRDVPIEEEEEEEDDDDKAG